MKIKMTVRLEKMLLLLPQRWFLAKKGWPRQDTSWLQPSKQLPLRQPAACEKEHGKVPVSAPSPPARGKMCRHPAHTLPCCGI